MWEDSSLIWEWYCIEAVGLKEINTDSLWIKIKREEYVVFYDNGWKIALDYFNGWKISQIK